MNTIPESPCDRIRRKAFGNLKPYTREQLMKQGLTWPCNYLKPGQTHPSQLRRPYVWTDREPVIPGQYWVRAPLLSQRIVNFYRAAGSPYLRSEMHSSWWWLWTGGTGRVGDGQVTPSIQYAGPIDEPVDRIEAPAKLGFFRRLMNFLRS